MSAQLEHPQPRATHLRVAPSAPSADPEEREPDRGLPLLLSFVGALAVIVADVVVIGAVDESWILIPGFVVLLLMTVIVFTMIMRLLADSGEKAAGDER
jgi:hypothetical protein